MKVLLTRHDGLLRIHSLDNPENNRIARARMLAGMDSRNEAKLQRYVRPASS
jgi:hypothetical protein